MATALRSFFKTVSLRVLPNPVSELSTNLNLLSAQEGKTVPEQRKGTGRRKVSQGFCSFSNNNLSRYPVSQVSTTRTGNVPRKSAVQNLFPPTWV